MKLNKPYLRFWISIPIFLLLGILLNDNYEFNVHDLYIIISSSILSIYISVFMFISGLGYFFFRKNEFNKTLEKIHWILSLFGLTLIICIFVVSLSIDYRYTGNFEEIKNNNNLTFLLIFGQIIGFTAIIIGFILYLFNIIMSILKLPKKQ